MKVKIDASPFQYSSETYEKTFLEILKGFIACYEIMLKDKPLLPNDENKIRDKFFTKYLKNDIIRNKANLTPYLIEAEPAEYNQDGELVGKLDFKIYFPNTFIKTSEYFIIECKRLDNKNLYGKTGLNAKYIDKGIRRFTVEQYSSFKGINGMIGFIVEPMDIDQNIEAINSLIKNKFKNIITKILLTKTKIKNNFDYSYYSLHLTIKGKNIKLYHLMFDLSHIIQN